jgi:hypothetical protein
MPLVDEHFSLMAPYQNLHKTSFLPYTEGLIQETRVHTQLSAIKTRFSDNSGVSTTDGCDFKN